MFGFGLKYRVENRLPINKDAIIIKTKQILKLAKTRTYLTNQMRRALTPSNLIKFNNSLHNVELELTEKIDSFFDQEKLKKFLNDILEPFSKKL